MERKLQHVINVLTFVKVIKWDSESSSYLVDGADPFYTSDAQWNSYEKAYEDHIKHLNALDRKV